MKNDMEYVIEMNPEKKRELETQIALVLIRDLYDKELIPLEVLEAAQKRAEQEN